MPSSIESFVCTARIFCELVQAESHDVKSFHAGGMTVGLRMFLDLQTFRFSTTEWILIRLHWIVIHGWLVIFVMILRTYTRNFGMGCRRMTRVQQSMQRTIGFGRITNIGDVMRLELCRRLTHTSGRTRDNKALNRSDISRRGRFVPRMVGFANFTIRSTQTDGDIEQIQTFLLQKSESARLWNFCGDAIQMSDSDTDRYSLDDARLCYETAIDKFPNDPEGYESLGFWHDCFGTFDRAKHYFTQAIDRTDSETPRLGLARVLAQMGHRDEGLAILATCPDQDSLDLKVLRDEIHSGNWSPRA